MRPGCFVYLRGVSDLEQDLGEPGVQLWNVHYNFIYGCKENKAVTQGPNVVQTTEIDLASLTILWLLVVFYSNVMVLFLDQKTQVITMAYPPILKYLL